MDKNTRLTLKVTQGQHLQCYLFYRSPDACTGLCDVQGGLFIIVTCC